MTKRGANSNVWSDNALQAFEELKKAFSTAPVLAHPDPSKPFIMEVDASESGVGAVLSQRTAIEAPLHPCVFFSQKLSDSERNYDIGNRELLAIILALKEWRHLLEGSQIPLIILTDHKNLAYLADVKRLSPRQARWSLFLSRFNYFITYRPGSRNTKADALSRQFEDEEIPHSDPVPLIPSKNIIATVCMQVSSQLIERIQSSQDSAPTSKPPDKLYVKESERVE